MASLDDRLNNLLQRWEDLRQQGQDVIPEDLCHTAPELLDELKRRIRGLQALDPLLQTAERVKLTVGAQLGQYEILGPLGAGGMGQVFSARDVKLDRRVAIKVMHDASVVGSNWLDRIAREARL